jgi:uncharacterized integral membrane protein
MSNNIDGFELGDGPEESSEPVIHDVEPGVGIPWGVIVLFGAIALVVVFAVQNTDDVAIRFLWMEGDFPLSIAILATAVVSVLIGELIGVVYRRRRRKRSAEQEELRQFRSQG